MSQVDSFLRLHWNMEYEDKMPVKKATEIVINILIFSVAATGVQTFFDDEFGIEVSVPMCNSMRSNLYLLSACQLLLLFGVSSFVTFYVVKTVLRLQATVAPVVNLPPQCQIKTSVPRQNDPNRLTVEDLENEDPVPGPSRPIPTVSYKVNQEQVRILEAKVDQNPSIDNKSGPSEVSIQRQNSNPNMFYRVNLLPCVIPPPLVNPLDKAWKVLKVCLQGCCIVACFLPLFCMHTFLFFSGQSCEDHLFGVQVSGLIFCGGFVVYTALVFRKLYKISQN